MLTLLFLMSSAFASVPSPTPSALPLKPTIQMGTLTGATATEKDMVAKGVAYANTVAASDCFKTQVLKGKYYEVFTDTPQKIWENINSKSPLKINFDIYTGSWWENHVDKTIGYENEPGLVHMNRYFVNTAYMVGDNAMHEGFGHSVGYTHYVKSTMLSSEPYQMNHFYEICFSQLKLK